ncbi:MAG TPA: prolipoprotein diacylglyceryl transferase [Thermoleophilia bacterium]|nr:prolipoprotein diacylglyceryl transferase [Thermoleophilia bacterium]
MLAYITINIDPVIGHTGFFTWRWYPLIMAAATIVGSFVFASQLRRKGIDAGHVTLMLFAVVPCAIVGARLYSVLDNWGSYSHDLVAIVRPPYSGLAIYGVLTGGILALIVYCRVAKLPTLRVLDCLALAIPVGQVIGRCANVINGDTWGPPTRLPWGFVYTNPHALLPAALLGVPTHPTPVYEQLWLVVMIVILWYAVPRLRTDGMAILLYLGLYSFGRFFISFCRVNNILLLGLREAQIIALVVLVAVVPAAVLLRRRALRLNAKTEARGSPSLPRKP